MFNQIQDMLWILSPVLRASVIFAIGAYTRMICIRNSWGDPWTHAATAVFLTLCFFVSALLAVYLGVNL